MVLAFWTPHSFFPAQSASAALEYIHGRRFATEAPSAMCNSHGFLRTNAYAWAGQRSHVRSRAPHGVDGSSPRLCSISLRGLLVGAVVPTFESPSAALLPAHRDRKHAVKIGRTDIRNTFRRHGHWSSHEICRRSRPRDADTANNGDGDPWIESRHVRPA